MRTIEDFRADAVVTIKLQIDADDLVEVQMQPGKDGSGVGVTLVFWDDFSVGDTRDLLRFAAESLTRFLQRADSIEIDAENPGALEKEEPPKYSGWPF